MVEELASLGEHNFHHVSSSLASLVHIYEIKVREVRYRRFSATVLGETYHHGYIRALVASRWCMPKIKHKRHYYFLINHTHMTQTIVCIIILR